MSITKGTTKISETPGRERMSTRAGSQLQQDPNYSRNANNSMILISAGKPATAERQAAAGTTGVVAIVETGGESPVHQIFATGVVDTTANHLFIRYLPPVSLTPVANNGNTIRLLKP
jgi:hypothetical protein